MSKPKKQARIHCFIQTRSDSHHTASGTATATVPQSKALQLARQIEETGSAGDLAKSFNLNEGERFTSGHGVLIVYSSGRKRLVQQYN